MWTWCRSPCNPQSSRHPLICSHNCIPELLSAVCGRQITTWATKHGQIHGLSGAKVNSIYDCCTIVPSTRTSSGSFSKNELLSAVCGRQITTWATKHGQIHGLSGAKVNSIYDCCTIVPSTRTSSGSFSKSTTNTGRSKNEIRSNIQRENTNGAFDRT
ncbi:hypothetical protein CHS0354_033091, partial [Potamilus streckersoni]